VPDGHRTGTGGGVPWLTHLQWPAMLVTVGAAWLTGSSDESRRKWGFWLFLLSNVLWIVWAVHDRAWALIVLQVSLAVVNIRGAKKNEQAEAEGSGS
jgi:hypothetical protein